MPATLREVLKTHTFEQQRQIINTLAEDFFDYSSGTGFSTFLNLVDGTVSSPALFFDSDNSLGLYKSSSGTVTIASTDSNVISFKRDEVYSTKPLSVNKNAIGNLLGNADIFIQNGGSSYAEGSYSGISLLGGTGSNATANIVVSGIGGSITNTGSGYTPGTYNGVSLTGGDGSGLTANITIDGIAGTISGGSGYIDGDYFDVPLINGSGSGAKALINISGGAVQSVTITDQGNFGYLNGNILTASNSNLGGTGSGFTFTITNYPFRINSNNFIQTSSGTGYNIGNTLSVNSADVGGTGSGFSYRLSGGGIITSINLAEGGSGYTVGDILTVDAADFEAVTEYQVEVRSSEFLLFNTPYPTTGFFIGSTATIGAETRTISRVYTSGSDIVGIIIDTSTDGNFTNPIGQTITSGGGSATVASQDVANMYYIDTGSGFVAASDIVLQTGKTYKFSSADFTNHPAAFSTTADGTHAGGLKYNGSEVTYSQTEITIKLTNSSPEPLYIFCEVHPNMNGFDGYEGQITKGSAYIPSGSGAEIKVLSILDQTYFYVDLDGNVEANNLTVNDIIGNNFTVNGSIEISGETIFSGDTNVEKVLTVGDTANIGDSLTVLKNLIVSTSLSDGTGEILCSTSNNIVLGFFSSFLTEVEEGTIIYNKDGKFIGVIDTIDSDTRFLLKENSRLTISTSEAFKYTSSAGLFYDDSTKFLGISNLIPEYSIDIAGNFKTDEDTILSENVGFKTIIGDRLNLDSMTAEDKLYVDGNIVSSGKIFLPNSTNLSSPSLTFSDSTDVGLYYNNTDKYISITGISGELSSYRFDRINNYRDLYFINRIIDQYLINSGFGYDNGTYSEVLLSGGSGYNLTANLTVAFKTKTITPGEGYTGGVYAGVPLTGGSGTGAIAEVTISSGNIVDNIQVTNSGSNYETTPEVTFTDASGSGAIAVAFLSSSGSLKNIGINSSGSGYTSAPTVIIGTEWSASNTVEIGQQYFYGSNLYTVILSGTFDGSTPPSHTSGSALNGTAELEYAGTVATATASLGTEVGVNDDQIDFIVINDFGSGYTTPPQILLSGGGGEGAAAVAILGFTVASVSVLDGGEGYVSPTVVFTGGNSSTTAVATASVTNQGVSKVVITDPGDGNYIVGDPLSFSESSLLDDQGNPSQTPTTAASLEVTALGAVTVVDITDFGYGYEKDDLLTIDVVENPELSSGSNFNITIFSTADEDRADLDIETGLFTATGLKALTDGVNVNDSISISDSTIAKSTSGNLLLTAVDYVQASGTKAFIVPAGTTAQRPGLGVSGTGAIRFNTTESRFEGFNGSFFVSLGGVRDVDGNTYISAELNPGDNDNILRFVNDDVQSMQVEQNRITLQTITNIDKTNIDGIPVWVPGDEVLAGVDPAVNYVYHENNVYSIDTDGTFDVLTPPTHTTGTVANGDVDLTYVRSIYGALNYRGTDLNLTLDRVNLNSNTLRIFGSTSTSANLITQAPEFIVGFGSTNKPLLKLSSLGGLLVNNGFSGSTNYIEILDYNLKKFNLKDTQILSAVSNLDTSVGNAVNIVIAEYDNSTSSLPLHSGKLMVEIIDDAVVPRRQYSEISFLAKSDFSDILYTENNKIYSDIELCDISIGIDGSNNITCDVVDLTGSPSTIYSIKVVSQAILV